MLTKHKFYFFLIFIFILNLNANAQYVDIINSNRPGFSVSPYNVGRGIFQVETGILGSSERLGKDDTDGVLRGLGIGITLRYSYNDDLEFYSELNTQGNWTEVGSVVNSEVNFHPLSIGASYKFFEGYDYFPTMAIRGGLMYYESIDNVSYGDLDLTFSTQNDFAPNWVFITNLKARKIIFDTELGYTLSITNTISRDWSWFIENFGKYNNNIYNNFVSAGLAYLVDNNMQLDAFGGMNTQLDKPVYYFSIGLSWRLDKRKYNVPRGAESINDPDFSRNKP